MPESSIFSASMFVMVILSIQILKHWVQYHDDNNNDDDGDND